MKEYWYKIIGSACEECSEVQAVNFKYINGQYLVDPMNSGGKYQDLQEFELGSINNESMSEYVVNNISNYSIKYDYKNEYSLALAFYIVWKC